MLTKKELFKTARIKIRLNIWDESAQVGKFVSLHGYVKEENAYWVRTHDNNSYYVAEEFLDRFVL
jgi:hypothetical protein